MSFMTPLRSALIRALARLTALPNAPGQWGKFLACILTFGWSLSLFNDSAGSINYAGVDPWDDAIGRHLVAAVLLICSIIPIIGILSGNIYIRMVGTTVALSVWILIIGTAFYMNGAFRPTTFTALVCVLAFINAEYKLAQEVIRSHG